MPPPHGKVVQCGYVLCVLGNENKQIAQHKRLTGYIINPVEFREDTERSIEALQRLTEKRMGDLLLKY